MKSRDRNFHRQGFLTVFLIALLLPSGFLAADECAAPLESEPIVLRGERIPSFEVFETFLLHASVVHEMQGPDAYRDFLANYGLNPDLESLQELPLAFDGLERSLHDGYPPTKHEETSRVGEIFAKVLSDIANDAEAIESERQFRLEVFEELRSTMSWVFVDDAPNFAAIDEAEEQFNLALDGPGGFSFAGEKTSEASMPETHSPHGAQVTISFLGHDDHGDDKSGDDEHGLGDDSPSVLSTAFEWRRYAREDGSVRVIGVIDSGSEPLGLVDVTFRSGEHLRDEFKQEGVDGLLRFAEYFQVDARDLDKSHTSFGCIVANAAAALACVACVADPTHISCGACAVAIAAAGVACSAPHCNQIQCNANCVNACALYGLCSSTSGSSTPADCNCVGQRFDTPGCRPPICEALVTGLTVLPLTGSNPVQLPTEPVRLRRLEESDVMHHGEDVSYLMGEWAILDYGTSSATTKSAPSIRTLSSSSSEFASSMTSRFRGTRSTVPSRKAGIGDGIAIIVAAPPHEANSRDIPMPSLKVSAGMLPVGAGSGKIAIRADFSEDGVLQKFDILYDTMGGVSPQLATHIEQALSLERLSQKEHRVVAFAVLSVGASLEIESSLPYLPKCCCGDQFCI